MNGKPIKFRHDVRVVEVTPAGSPLDDTEGILLLQDQSGGQWAIGPKRVEQGLGVIDLLAIRNGEFGAVESGDMTSYYPDAEWPCLDPEIDRALVVATVDEELGEVRLRFRSMGPVAKRYFSVAPPLDRRTISVLNVYNGSGDWVASTRHSQDAVRLAPRHGENSTVRFGHDERDTLFDVGDDTISAMNFLDSVTGSVEMDRSRLVAKGRRSERHAKGAFDVHARNGTWVASAASSEDAEVLVEMEGDGAYIRKRGTGA